MAWHTTNEAEYDLQFIAEQGIIQFGPQAARAYVSRLVAMFDIIAMHPSMAAERQTSTGTVRLLPYGSHNILYLVEEEVVTILRVLHGLQNWFELL